MEITCTYPYNYSYHAGEMLIALLRGQRWKKPVNEDESSSLILFAQIHGYMHVDKKWIPSSKKISTLVEEDESFILVDRPNQLPQNPLGHDNNNTCIMASAKVPISPNDLEGSGVLVESYIPSSVIPSYRGRSISIHHYISIYQQNSEGTIVSHYSLHVHGPGCAQIPFRRKFIGIVACPISVLPAECFFESNHPPRLHCGPSPPVLPPIYKVRDQQHICQVHLHSTELYIGQKLHCKLDFSTNEQSCEAVKISLLLRENIEKELIQEKVVLSSTFATKDADVMHIVLPIPSDLPPSFLALLFTVEYIVSFEYYLERTGDDSLSTHSFTIPVTVKCPRLRSPQEEEEEGLTKVHWLQLCLASEIQIRGSEPQLVIRWIMHGKSIRPLDESVQDQILASSNLASYSQAVEEVILNSIDAKSTRIDIEIDLELFLFKVMDNGKGVQEADLRHSVGEWHHTSKALNEASYGCKGRALATLRYLSSELEIVTRTNHTDQAFAKKFSHGNLVYCKSIPSSRKISPGTSLEVKGLFAPYQVRQKATHYSTERYQILEFIKKMSVLHHHIYWHISEQSQVLLQLTSHRSVTKRLMTLHGVYVLSHLTQIDYQHGPYRLQGLLSYPDQEHCSASPDVQYFYVNHRWCRNKDLVSTLLNSIYSQLLDSEIYGPRRKHNIRQKIYPFFVLHLICPIEEYDILVEPDKTKVLFRAEGQVKEMVVNMLQHCFRINARQIVFPNAIESSKASLPIVSGFLPPHLPSSLPPPSLPPALPYAVQKQSPETIRTNLLDLFVEGFSPPVGFDPLPERSPYGTVASASQSSEWKGEYVGVTVQRTPPIMPYAPPTSSIGSKDCIADIEQRELDWFEESRLEAERAGMIGEEEESTSLSDEMIDFDIYKYIQDYEGDNGRLSCITTPISQPRVRDGILSVPNKSKPPLAKPSSYPLPTLNHSIHLDKAQLSNVVYINQWDKKILLAYDAEKQLLLGFDQHAVHERIMYEELSKAVVIESHAFSKPIKVRVNREEKQCLEEKKKYFQKFGFQYTLQTQAPSSAQEQGVESCNLVLQAVGRVYNENLKLSDCLELCHQLMTSTIPSLCKPSAVIRILSSLSCKRAVKFNTSLTADQAKELLGGLNETDLPFQCAHGRPSVVPIANISHIVDQERANSVVVGKEVEMEKKRKWEVSNELLSKFITKRK